MLRTRDPRADLWYDADRMPASVYERSNRGVIGAAVPGGSAQPRSGGTLSDIWKRLRVALVVWLAMVGVDFVLNAALFAGMYKEGGAFMLAPGEAFRRIPLGYVAFLMLAVGIVELSLRLGIATLWRGIRLGAATGVVLGAAWSLGLYSIATLSPQVALAFAAIWFGLFTAAGGVAAAGLRRSSLRGLTLRVVGMDVLAAIAVVALQSFGVLPTLTP